MSGELEIKKVCVIGAGTMGSGIAAHLANIGFNVTLLDANQQLVAEAFERAKQARPPHFFVPETASAIRLGSVTEQMGWLTEADWVCEAIIERRTAKKDLLRRIEPHLKPTAIISTNTSGLEIGMLAEDCSEGFRKRFLGTHFFNPPRYLKLLELIPTADTEPALVEKMTRFLETKVARRVVLAKDSPGFIANRYGMWCMYHAIHVAEKLHLTIEQVDLITGPFMGHPKSGSFRLNDIVGLDVMNDIAQNLLSRCPNDPYIKTLNSPKSLSTLLERRWIGEKVGQGYYRKEGKELLALDLVTLAYRNKVDVSLPSVSKLFEMPLGERVDQGLELKDETGEFLRHFLPTALKYADYLKEEVSHSIVDFDHVMEWGFGWQLGPFKTIDAIGANRIGSQSPNFYVDQQALDFKGRYAEVIRDPEYIEIVQCPLVSELKTFNVRDLGDNVHALCLKTKMGVITPEVCYELTAFLERAPKEKLILTSEAKCFSVGFDLKFFLKAITEERWSDIDRELSHLQETGELLERTGVVAALFGYALGGGLELALSCSKIVALADTQIGLPEAKVGLLPGGRGTTLLRIQNQESVKRLAEVAQTLTNGTVASNAVEAIHYGFLRPGDQLEYHPDRLIYEAKVAALTVTPRVLPNLETPVGPLGGMIDRQLVQAIQKGNLTKHDETIGQKIKVIFAKGISYQDCLAKERSEFLDLCSKALTVARINHMLENGKPLRN